MHKFYKKSIIRLKILSAIRVTRMKSHTDAPQILGAIVKKISRHGDLAPRICEPLI